MRSGNLITIAFLIIVVITAASVSNSGFFWCMDYSCELIESINAESSKKVSSVDLFCVDFGCLVNASDILIAYRQFGWIRDINDFVNIKSADILPRSIHSPPSLLV